MRSTLGTRALLLAVLSLGLPSAEFAAPPPVRLMGHAAAKPPAPPPAHATEATARFAANARPAMAVAGLRGPIKPQVSGRVGGPAPYDARRSARFDGGLVAPRR
jgi:hypothetical protein